MATPKATCSKHSSLIRYTSTEKVLHYQSIQKTAFGKKKVPIFCYFYANASLLEQNTVSSGIAVDVVGLNTLYNDNYGTLFLLNISL